MEHSAFQLMTVTAMVDVASCMSALPRPQILKRLLPMLATLACLAGAAQARANTVPVGLYTGPGNVARNSSFSTWLGEPVPYATDYVPYTNGWTTDFDPTWLLNAWGPWVNAVSGRRLVLGVPLLENGYAGQFSQESAGAFDQYFRGLGQQLVSHGLANTIIRLGYEANNPKIGPWQATDNPAGFISAYRHIVGVLRDVTGSNFAFDWTANAGLTPNKPLNSLASFYPGDDAVEIIGLDVYDFGGSANITPQQRWNDLLTEQFGLRDQKAFAAAHGKPVSFPEWGLYAVQSTPYPGGGGDDPYYIDHMADWFATSNTAYQSYLDWNWGGGVLSDYPNAQARYHSDFGSVSPPRGGPRVTLSAPTPARCSTRHSLSTQDRPIRLASAASSSGWTARRSGRCTPRHTTTRGRSRGSSATRNTPRR